MTGVLDHQSDIVVFCKLDPSSDVRRTSCVYGIRWKVAEIALWIVLEAERCIDRSARFDKWVAVSCRELCQPGVVGPVGCDVLTSFAVVSNALVAWFGDGLVTDELSSNGCIKFAPSRRGGPAVV